MGLAKRTRSLFSLKDRELVELESALPEDEVELKEDEEKDVSLLETSTTVPEINETEELENEDDWTVSIVLLFCHANVPLPRYRKY